jgi:hypothetical protein
VPVTPLHPGDPAVVGPHRLLGRLGQGGMGTVFLGVSPDERAVAVKVLRDGVVDPDSRRRFRHELEALRRVRGPHVVEVLDADVDAQLPYLVTRFVPGRRLDELVAEQGPLDPAALRVLARGLADALTTLHREGVVHRDLTPGNVLVVDGSPQVIDLGLATAADLTIMTRSGLLMGTPGYLSPEQVTGGTATAAADVHAWGATVALAGTGRPPFGTGRPEAVLYRIVHDEPDLVGLPEDLLRLVEAALSRDASQRPAADDLLDRLGGASTEQTVAIHLPRDVDATRVLTAPALQPHRELVPAAGGPVEPPEEAYDELVPWDELPPEPRRPARTAQVLVTGVAALAVVATGALVAPLVTAAVALALVVLVGTVTRSSERLARRRQRRGDRRRDPVVAALGTPWHLLAALLDALVSLPLLALAAAAPAGLVYLLDPTVNGLEGPELTAATAIVVALVVSLSRRGNRRSRRALRDALVTATPTASGGVAVVAVLLVSAVLLLATAEGSAPTWWPLR